MRKPFVVFGLLMASAMASAHPPDDGPPWNEYEDWRLITFSNNRSEAYFLANTLTQRAGSAATVELLTVRRIPDQKFGTDQYHQHMLVDCDNFIYVETDQQQYLPKGPFPPSIVMRRPPEQATEGTILRLALEMGCGAAPLQPEKIADPYKWALSQFKQR